MKPFRERNPVIVGAVSLVVLAMVMVAALRADDLPIIGGGDTYHAMFTEAGGLKVNDEVRIAGVRVGKVNEVELAGDEVKVTFKVDDAADFLRWVLVQLGYEGQQGNAAGWGARELPSLTGVWRATRGRRASDQTSVSWTSDWLLHT